MNNLDEKLREIELDPTNTDDYYTLHLTDEAIAQIKQAFADEGFLIGDGVTKNDLGLKKTIQAHNKITGQEWYDRFEKVLDNRGKIFFLHKEDIMKVAREVSGLE